MGREGLRGGDSEGEEVEAEGHAVTAAGAVGGVRDGVIEGDVETNEAVLDEVGGDRVEAIIVETNADASADSG